MAKKTTKPTTTKNQPKSNPNSTQNSLKIAELKEGMVIMKDGTFRAVISCKSINFDLMSTREKEAIEFSYQSFLNSLFFPIQILVRSKKVDIGPYLEKLVKIRSEQDNMLLNVLMDDYINYIDLLSQKANIMEKTFYVVLPYYPNGDLENIKQQTKNLFTKISSTPVHEVKINKNNYDKAKEEIQNRVNVIISGLESIGVQAKQLNTKELGQLYYSFYNPDTSVNEPLPDFNNATNLYTKKGEGLAPNPNLEKGEM